MGPVRRDHDDVRRRATRPLADPGPRGADRSWRGYARTFFSAVTEQARAAGVKRRARAVPAAGRSPTLRSCEPWSREPPRSRSSRSTTAACSTRSIGHQLRGRSARVRRRSSRAALRSPCGTGCGTPRRPSREPQAGVLFIPYQAGQIAALRSTISAWMRLAIFEAMNRRRGRPAPVVRRG